MVVGTTTRNDALRRFEVAVDVGDVTPWPDAHIVATVIVPDEPPGGHPSRILAVCFPGGGYSRRYWDIDWPGGYSQAAFHASRGWTVVAIDHLGVGDSTVADESALPFEVLAAANDAAVRRIRAGLTTGTLVDGLEPVAADRVIALGQSMGGCVSIVMQATHRTCDALGVLGYSAIHTVLPSPSGGVEIDAVARGRTDREAIEAEADAIGGIDVFSWAFHCEDVEPALLQADLEGGFPFRTESVPPWGSATIPPAAASMLSPGVVAAEAAAVDVPVFIGVGDRDVCPDPRREPAAYAASSDITVQIVPSMAHMHNFASTRAVLWERLHAWGATIVRSDHP